jgi:hypothetical protein
MQRSTKIILIFIIKQITEPTFHLHAAVVRISQGSLNFESHPQRFYLYSDAYDSII